MLSRIAEKSYSFINHELPSLYFSSILFGQVFISMLANILNIENRTSMIVFRFSIMTLSYGFVFLCMRLKKLSLFSNLWVISLIVFWLLYLARLLFDVYISGSKLSMPAWELLAWSWGSSLPIAICTYLYASLNNLNFILSKVVKQGVFMLGISICSFYA